MHSLSRSIQLLLLLECVAAFDLGFEHRHVFREATLVYEGRPDGVERLHGYLQHCRLLGRHASLLPHSIVSLVDPLLADEGPDAELAVGCVLGLDCHLCRSMRRWLACSGQIVWRFGPVLCCLYRLHCWRGL